MWFFSTFREITPCPSSGCAGGWVEPKLKVMMKMMMMMMMNFGSTQPPAHPEEVDGVISRKVENP